MQIFFEALRDGKFSRAFYNRSPWQGQVDALCTVIALGFIISSESQFKNHSYIIYLDGTDDDDEYWRQEAKLAGTEKLFDPEPQTSGGKARQPVILAQTNRSVLQGEIMDG